MTERNKQYEAKNVEAKWYAHWIEKNYFHADPNDEGEPYSIVIPPPNVTGILHMGHALNSALQDVLIRWKRMDGYNAVWIPGTDHASIATEQKVVTMLAEQGIDKNEIGREAYMEHAWDWKNKYGGIITDQLRRLGCSCDWERERFTMDEDYTRAVYEAFVRLYDKGLIERGHRLVNWCPKSQSAISDEEVEHKEVQGKLWHFKYPIVDSKESVVVATTRPETMLGDTAVAVNPNDARFKNLIGNKILLPIVDREIPIIADSHVDPEFGTGCVKVTPAHDPNDFAIGNRHDLECINIMNPDASMNDRVPEAYRGLSREAARKKVVADLDAAGLLVKIEDHMHKVGYSQRGNVPIESYMSEQWFMRMKTIARPALDAVMNGEIRLTPTHWVKTYQHWLENIQDWCISRQLWWGQRIPVWYRKGGNRNNPEDRHVSVNGPSDPENWEQDEDVLDTWASSWLWPFAVHNWPNENDALAKYYPTSVLATGPDIIFFWVARMVMAGIEFLGENPFKDVYFHGIVRDDQGRKMSKSLGNSIDPLEIIDTYSADALRFTLVMLTATGQDVYVDTKKFEVGRNFGTKIWNASRFMQMQKAGSPTHLDDPQFDPEQLSFDDRHILHRLQRTISSCNENLEKFRFNDYAKELYDFLWHNYCDWYLEYTKQVFASGNEQRIEAVWTVSHHVFSSALRLLHPIMPFITEELWHTLGYTSLQETIMKAPWPKARDTDALKKWNVTGQDAQYVEYKHDVIRVARVLRADYNLVANKHVAFVLKPGNDTFNELLQQDEDSLKAFLRTDNLSVDMAYEPQTAAPSMITQLGNLYMPVDGLIDTEAEVTRLLGQLEKVQNDLEKINKKLSNQNFVERAPKEAVDIQRNFKTDLIEKQEKLTKLIDTLKPTE